MKYLDAVFVEMNISYAGKLNDPPKTQCYEEIWMDEFNLVRFQIEDLQMHESSKSEGMELRD